MNVSRPGPRAASGAGLLWLLAALAGTPAALAGAGDAPRPATPLEKRSLYLDGDAVGDHMIVVGERGHILVSRDGGLSWVRAAVPSRVTLTGVALHDATRGWAVGHDALILRTDDGGDTWETVHAAPEQERPLLDVWFANAEHGIAVGAYGYFLETTDGGGTWRSRTVAGSDRHLNHIAAGPSGRLFVAAESGRVYRSDDGAASWIELPSPYAGSFFGTLPIDDRRVYVYGLRGHLFYSDDAGAHWKSVDTGTRSMLTDGLVLADESVVFTAMGGIVLTGGARAAGLALHRRGDRASLAGALPAGDGTLVTYGEFGVERVSARQFERAP